MTYIFLIAKLLYLVAKLIYYYKCLSVRLSVFQLRLGENAIFSASILFV